jgi:hypothetical protein
VKKIGCMILSKILSIRLWGEVAHIVIYILKKTNIIPEGNLTPLEAWCDVKLN